MMDAKILTYTERREAAGQQGELALKEFDRRHEAALDELWFGRRTSEDVPRELLLDRLWGLTRGVVTAKPSATIKTFSVSACEFHPVSGHTRGLAKFKATLVTEGNWAHPSGKYSVAATPETMRSWVERFNKMKAAGQQTFIPIGHGTDPLGNAGFVESMSVETMNGKAALVGLLDILDAEVAGKMKAGLITALSIGLDPETTISRADGSIERLGEAIQHVALTLLPVVPTAGKFQTLN
jgi:hypothetical protein